MCKCNSFLRNSTIEIDLREMLGEIELPLPVKASNEILM